MLKLHLERSFSALTNIKVPSPPCLLCALALAIIPILRFPRARGLQPRAREGREYGIDG